MPNGACAPATFNTYLPRTSDYANKEKLGMDLEVCFMYRPRQQLPVDVENDIDNGGAVSSSHMTLLCICVCIHLFIFDVAAGVV